MSNLPQQEQVQQLIQSLETPFNELAKIHGAVDFRREASFALAILKEKPYTASIAAQNQDSLKRAIVNVAACGLTLSPIHKLAYLVPRDKQIILDPSYLGLIHLAIECGAILWAAAEIVCQNDKFTFMGVNREPIHQFNPFDGPDDRGDIVGGYVLAKTPGGEFLFTHMPIRHVYGIRDRSDSWKAFKDKGTKSPWVTDEAEMIKKTLIRRAYKSWPKTEGQTRLERVIDVMNDADPINFDEAPMTALAHDGTDRISAMRKYLVYLERTEEAFIKHLCATTKREIKKLDELTQQETDRAIVLLEAWVSAKKKKEVPSENAG